MLRRAADVGVGQPLTAQHAMCRAFESESISYVRQFLPLQVLMSAVRVHEGSLHVFRDEEGYREVTKYDFGEQIMSSPIPFEDGLLIRTKTAIYRY